MESIWKNTIEKTQFESLRGDIKKDILIIGGGMCGILCAYMLREKGADCVLVEQDRILSGVTERTTAKVTFQHGLIYNKIMSKYGTEKAQLYYESQKSALEKIKEISLRENCDFKECSSFVYSLKDTREIEKELEALSKIGCKAHFTHKTELPFSIKGAVKIENQAKFHPLKFAFSILDGLKIYENTKVLELKGNTALTDKGKIMAKKIIVATHFPFINKHGGYFLKMYQDRSYVLALGDAAEIKDMYVGEEKDSISIRSYKNLLLLGGGSHRTGAKGGSWKELEKFAKKYYPQAKEEERWATQDCMTLDYIPYIGQYSKGTPDLYVATGFNKWGMTSSMVAADILSDMIMEKENEYEKLYLPARSVFHKQLAVNMFESAKGLATPTKPRCPHLGCALKYNKAEHSWDCPCHGSRFDESGKLLNNPATANKRN